MPSPEITFGHVRFDDKDVWLSQQQIALLFDTTQQNVSLHINDILNEGELSKETTHKYFLLVRQEGNRPVKRQIEHYNLDMIIVKTPIFVPDNLNKLWVHKIFAGSNDLVILIRR
jgi:hypothetical protein